MKKFRVLSIILCLTLVMSCISFTAMAASFSDVDNDATVSWAKESIEKMTDAGYIKGYEDNTFKAQNNATRAEAAVMIARLLELI